MFTPFVCTDQGSSLRISIHGCWFATFFREVLCTDLNLVPLEFPAFLAIVACIKAAEFHNSKDRKFIRDLPRQWPLRNFSLMGSEIIFDPISD